VAILNQRDYRTAKARLTQIEAALAPMNFISELTTGLSIETSSARRKALQAEAQKLRNDLEAYDRLQSTIGAAKKVTTDELGLLPIVGRIARKLSQRDLAELLDVSEQQIQRYESDRYASVNLSRYSKILEILGVELNSRLSPTWPSGKAQNESAEQPLNIDSALISELRKRNWVALPRGISKENAAKVLEAYVADTASLGKGQAMHRRYRDKEASINGTALSIWRAQVLRVANSRRSEIKTRFNIVDTSWLSKLANLSAHPDGPMRAVEFLRERGIVLVIVPHLIHTRLDGAAMLLVDGTPIIALTLRYDRLDSFWFTLFHEIGHVFLHFNHGLDEGFIDDLDAAKDSQAEREADSFAESAFVPDQLWDTCPARFSNAPELVRAFAEEQKIHPAVVAGRIRKERGDYRIFNNLLGNGSVRVMFSG